jgi:hypothetical protein
MSELEQPTRELPAVPEPPPAPGQGLDRATSVLAGLRVEHNAARGGRTKVFPIPGFKGKLACRYGVISVEEQRTIEQRALDTPVTNPYREMNLYADQLITACREFGTMDGGEFVPLDAERPVCWGDPRLLSGLEIDPGTESPTARQAILAVFRHVFGGEDGPWVLSEHHTAVMAWMRPSLDDADGEFAKNS